MKVCDGASLVRCFVNLLFDPRDHPASHIALVACACVVQVRTELAKETYYAVTLVRISPFSASTSLCPLTPFKNESSDLRWTKLDTLSAECAVRRRIHLCVQHIRFQAHAPAILGARVVIAVAEGG